MKLFKYWARSGRREIHANGKKHVIWCWGWSDVSPAEAKNNAEDRLDVISSNTRLISYDRYPYGVNPIREMIIETDVKNSLNPSYVISRNSYGSLVLNSARTMFVDIDLTISDSMLDALRRYISKWFFTVKNFAGNTSSDFDHFKLFGRKIEFFDLTGRDRAETKYINKIVEMAENIKGFSARIYRTPRGLRYLITHKEFDPESDEVFEIFGKLGGDPMYCKLCKCQKSFRARLTPKSWRCGIKKIKIIYPFDGAASKNDFEQWLTNYEAISEHYAACKYLTSIGADIIDNKIKNIIELHDKICRAHSELKLA